MPRRLIRSGGEGEREREVERRRRRYVGGGGGGDKRVPTGAKAETAAATVKARTGRFVVRARSHGWRNEWQGGQGDGCGGSKSRCNDRVDLRILSVVRAAAQVCVAHFVLILLIFGALIVGHAQESIEFVGRRRIAAARKPVPPLFAIALALMSARGRVGRVCDRRWRELQDEATATATGSRRATCVCGGG